MRRAMTRERDAFAELVDRYRDFAYGVAYHYVRNAEDAQDVVQEVFVQAYLHLNALREPEKFSAWLRRMTMNRCADTLRRRGLQRLACVDELDHVENRLSSARPYETWERVTDRLAAREALSKLSDKTRLTVTLCYLGGYSHTEIARFLEIPVNTVRSRLQIAKRQLREEMLTMVDEMLHAEKPDPAFTRRIVEEALRRGEEAMQSHARRDAIERFDAALTALENLPSGQEQRRLKMIALWKKGRATDPRNFGYAEAIDLIEQSLAIAVELGDRQGQAEKFMILGDMRYNANLDAESEQAYRSALRLYEEMGDTEKQAHSWMMLGGNYLHPDVKDVAQARAAYERALALLEPQPHGQSYANCRALLELLADVGDANFASLGGYATSSDVLEAQNGSVAFAWNWITVSYVWEDRPEETPLRILGVFEQIAALKTFLKAGSQPGESWSGKAELDFDPPLNATATVLGTRESVAVPAGTFAGCLLVEYCTSASNPAETVEGAKEALGTRQAWFAPGVGLIQLHVRRDDGAEATIQLQSYDTPGESQDMLPLAVGNSWTYGWANTPEGYTVKEVYHVTGQKDAQFYLSRYSYLIRPIQN